MTESRCEGDLLLCFGDLKNGLAMMRNLFLIVLLFVVLWIVRNAFASRRRGQRADAAPAPEMMVKCAHCGVNQPISESILTHGRYFCCNAHRLEAESKDA